MKNTRKYLPDIVTCLTWQLTQISEQCSKKQEILKNPQAANSLSPPSPLPFS